MSSRLAEKQERRQERVEWERERATSDRRRRLLFGGIAAASLLALAGLVGTVIFRGHSSKGEIAAPGSPFGPHYAGLEQRRTAAGVPTMMQTMGSSVHFHPRLNLFVNGRPMPVPANVGIDPGRPAMQMAGLHTHDATGTIHVEGVQGAKLGQLFAIWGVPFSSTRLGPYRATGNKRITMLVNGRPSQAFGRLPLADGQRIVIFYGSGSSPRPTG